MCIIQSVYEENMFDTDRQNADPSDSLMEISRAVSCPPFTFSTLGAHRVVDRLDVSRVVCPIPKDPD